MTKNQKKKRVGIRPGKFTCMVSFRDEDDEDFLKLMAAVQSMYRRQRFSQREIASMFDISVGMVGKMVRCDPHAPRL